MLCIACGPDNFPCKKYVIDDTRLCADHKHVVNEECGACDKPMYYRTKLSCDHAFCDDCILKQFNDGGVSCFTCSKFTYLDLFTECEITDKIIDSRIQFEDEQDENKKVAYALQLFEFVTKYYKCLMIPDVKYKKLWNIIYKKNIEFSEDDERFEKFTYELYFIKKLASRISPPTKKPKKSNRRRRSMRRKSVWIRVFPYP